MKKLISLLLTLAMLCAADPVLGFFMLPRLVLHEDLGALPDKGCRMDSELRGITGLMDMPFCFEAGPLALHGAKQR